LEHCLVAAPFMRAHARPVGARHAGKAAPSSARHRPEIAGTAEPRHRLRQGTAAEYPKYNP
jgi:hypothetical protein